MYVSEVHNSSEYERYVLEIHDIHDTRLVVQLLWVEYVLYNNIHARIVI